MTTSYKEKVWKFLIQNGYVCNTCCKSGSVSYDWWLTTEVREQTKCGTEGIDWEKTKTPLDHLNRSYGYMSGWTEVRVLEGRLVLQSGEEYDFRLSGDFQLNLY